MEGFLVWNGVLSSGLASSLLIMIVLGVVLSIIGNKVSKLATTDVPKGTSFIAVIFVEMINNNLKAIFPTHFNKFAPLLNTIIIYLLFANTVSIFGLTPPLTSINVALAFSVFAFVTIQLFALIIKKPKARFNDLASPNVVFLPINLIGEVATPFSMGIRLFGNLLSGTVIGTLVYGVTGIFSVLFAAFLIHPIFDIFFGAIQAYVYYILFSIFLSLAVED